MFTPEDELDVIHEDLGRARRALDLKERAPFEHRVADVDEYERSLAQARENVRELERELRVAQAEWDAALDAMGAA